MNKFRLLLEFCWMSSGGKNIVRNSLLRGELWLNYRCLWVWQFNYDCSWVVVDGGGEIMAGCARLWVMG